MIAEGIIRPYRPEDREGLFKIAGDTANFGEPIEAYMNDRRLFLDSFYRYYTDFEPEHAWVADCDGAVAGFLTGCADTQRHDRVMSRQVIPSVLGYILRGQYHFGRKTWNYLFRVGRAALSGEFAHVDGKLYPAHLHINVDTNYRGRGLGRGLIEVYLDQLCRLGVPGVHLITTSMNVAACKLYEKVGFHLLDARPTRLWAGIVDQAVENRAFGMVIS